MHDKKLHISQIIRNLVVKMKTTILTDKCNHAKDGTGDHHLHTGKPWQETGGLAWYDNRARWYDPVTMRFLAPDPLAGKYHDISPWAWCGNNPLRYSDHHKKK